MGVPSFYRWLAGKYPKIVKNCVEEKGECVDASLPNPNGMEFDNLYLDMNGIIHPCFHPEDTLLPPTRFEEVFNNICNYIDRIFNIVRPRKLLYMAIDGVAPRAKMNQQRSRRFRAAKEAETLENEEGKMRKQFELEGKVLLPNENSEVSDSNVITPGTEFMHELSKKLQDYINLRMETVEAWKNIQVILSDANVPGEGEHKIMNFIRAQRTCSNYNPNTKHCLYGLDADLIILALATHEVHFTILREDVLFQEEQFSGLSHLKCNVHKSVARSFNSMGPVKRKPYQFLHVWILREYLALDLNVTSSSKKFNYDLERIIDDFVFICFFVGNDFLPHMPTLAIHEGAVDLLIHVYKTEIEELGGYLVDMQQVKHKKGGYIKLKRVEKFILSVAQYEEKIFKKRSELREHRIKRILAADDMDADNNEEEVCEKHSDCASHNKEASTSVDVAIALGGSHTSSTGQLNDYSEALKNTKELKQKLKDYVRNLSDTFRNGGLADKVKLAEPGWKGRYYKEKFQVESAAEIESLRKSVVQKYTEGLCWVARYYFEGVPSWHWFYPYNYGPFASDLKGLSQVKVQFQKGLPFRPFDQLMAALPPRSAHALPGAYIPLMTNEDSNIVDFYPSDFKIDADGKRYLWQAICNLPFIDEDRLLNETKKLEKELKDQEVVRNKESDDRLFISRPSKLGSHLESLYKGCLKLNDTVKIDSTISNGINGVIHVKNEMDFHGNEDEQQRYVLCVFYECPRDRVHLPRLLEGVLIPEKTVDEEDISECLLWHEQRGSNAYSKNRNPQYEKVRKQIHNSDESPDLGMICKGAGRGWGVGRGRPTLIPETFPNEYSIFTPTPALPSRSYVRQNSAVSPSHSNMPQRGGRSQPGGGIYAVRGANTVTNAGRVDHMGIPEFGRLQISDSGQGFRSGPRTTGNMNFWPSNNSATSDREWRRARNASSLARPNQSMPSWSQTGPGEQRARNAWSSFRPNQSMPSWSQTGPEEQRRWTSSHQNNQFLAQSSTSQVWRGRSRWNSDETQSSGGQECNRWK